MMMILLIVGAQSAGRLLENNVVWETKSVDYASFGSQLGLWISTFILLFTQIMS